jgi:hypothetical protein
VKPLGHCSLALLALAAMLTGCQPAPPPAQHSPYITNGPQPDLTPDQVANSDPCSTELHDIEGLLLTYYALHKELPQDLDQLQPLIEPGAVIDFTCPTTHQPYIYIPGGIRSPLQSRQIILYDAVPHSNGFRWCIFVSPLILHPGASLVMEVQPVPEATFRTFLPPNPN